MPSATDGPKQFEAEAERVQTELTAEEAREIERLRREKVKTVDGGKVINPDGTEVSTEVDLSNVGEFVVERDGNFYDSRTDRQIEQTDDGQWTYYQPWPHGTLDYMGDEWEYRVPKPLAAMFLGVASRKQASPKKKLDAIIGYLEHTLSRRSFDRMMERAYDHEDEFDTANMAELVSQISSGGSARPTT